MNINYIFNSRETYKVASADWKAAYASHTLAIRKARAEYNQAQSEFSKTTYHYGKGYAAEINAPYVSAEKHLDATRRAREALRHEATAMLNDRAKMKLEAGRQYAKDYVAHDKVFNL